MKIYGIFRGFPGLGRVMAGMSILSELSSQGHIVKAYSYLQGQEALATKGFSNIIDEQPTLQQIAGTGLNPICNIGEKLIATICSDNPDLVIIDGEPLLISTLVMVFPREKVLSLLNPADLANPTLQQSSMKFYHRHYLAAGKAIVHGIDHDEILIPGDNYGCEIFCTHTILRKEVIDCDRIDSRVIAVILGGGCANSSEGFFESTVEIGRKALAVAALIPEEQFIIYCDDRIIADKLSYDITSDNVSIVAKYSDPKTIYSSAKAVICRAGRNTISEILYLNLPAILFASSGDYRSTEQEKNIEQACRLNPGRVFRSSTDSTEMKIKDQLVSVMDAANSGFTFKTGNRDALEYICGYIREIQS